jgi:hypothetical protein
MLNQEKFRGGVLVLTPQRVEFNSVPERLVGGCELADQAIELRPQLRVLYTTGNAITDKMKALFVKDAQFLGKPYTGGQLQASIKRLLAA